LPGVARPTTITPSFGYSEPVRLNPNYAVAFNRGIAWSDKGDVDRAIADFSDPPRPERRRLLLRSRQRPARQARQRPRHCRFQRGDPPQTERRPSFTIAAATPCGDYDRAIADYSEAIRLDPKDGDYYESRGKAWNAKGRQTTREGRLQRGHPERLG